ncbi:hypothetical protein AK830_g2575 [Neonectria ditissima]|uniref:GH16 domain-containing protein n=1 Tax=Neonectria ditissima TaxID=78410 RepID=A0A0P7BEJ0_9HYPO|nr:hypothetical protein AK830_g2575 [Neonectria ditissima]
MHLTSYLSVALAAAGLAVATPKRGGMKHSPKPQYKGGRYHVDRGMSFSNKAIYNFTGDSLPEGLSASDYQPDDAHTFTPSNVNVADGYLELLVDGGQTDMPYMSGEIVTDVQNILYASVRTVAILSEPAGVCNGMFFYKSDTQESDIEWLSDKDSESNGGKRKLWFTNQDANGDGKSTYRSFSPPSNPTTTEHEYRIDWTAGMTKFYVDGVKLWQTKRDVPDEAGPWIWNNWSNGDEGWSAGPPETDAVFKIKSIEMYYNTADD